MKILFNGGVLGNESLCILGENIVRQLSKNHTVKIIGKDLGGHLSRYHNSFDGEPDLFIMNGHVPHLAKFAEEFEDIISICVFETKLPSDWVEALNMPEIKQVWTISEFNKKIILDSGVNKPVHVIYAGVDDMFVPNTANLFPEDNSFKFLNISAPHCIGTRDRKGLDILLPAFKEEFGDSKNVRLILKLNTIYGEKMQQTILNKKFDLNGWLASLLPKDTNIDNISVITQYLSIDKLRDLMNSVDCGVFPARSESFNMPAVELLKMKKPVICSQYSAHTEYSDPKLMVKIKEMLPSDYNAYPYHNELLAEPDKEHLKKRMRWLYDNQLKYSYNLDTRFFSWDKMGERIEKNIKLFLKEKLKK